MRIACLKFTVALTTLAAACGAAAVAYGRERISPERTAGAPQAAWQVAADEPGRGRKTRNIMSVSPNIPDEPTATDVANSGRAKSDKDAVDGGATGSIGSDANGATVPAAPATRGLRR